MAVREYIGARYVPLFMGDWDNTKTYEPLSIVNYQGSSYTSRQYVPTAVDISNTVYWVCTGNYNAQVEQYRQEVQQYISDIDELSGAIDTLSETVDDVVTENNSNKQQIGEIKNNSAFYNSLTPNQNPQKIVDTLKSYIAHVAQFSYGGSSIYRYNDDFTYGNTTLNQNSKFPITCSPLTYLLMNGVEFNNSRFANGTVIGGQIAGGDNKSNAFSNVVNFNNESGKKYWQRNRDGEIIDNAVFSEGFAHYLDDCGMLMPIYDTTDFSDLAIGDLCFYETARDGDNPYYDTVFYYKDINHVDIYLGCSNNYMYFASTGTNPAIQMVKRSLNDSMFTKLKWHSRFNYGLSAAPTKLIDGSLALDHSGSGAYGYGNKTFLDDVVIPQDRNLCTLMIHLTEWTENVNLRISFVGSKGSETTSDTNALGRIHVDTKEMYLGNGWFYCLFDTEATGSPVSATDLNAIKISIAADAAYTIKGDWIVMYDSLVQPSIGRNFIKI